MSIIRLSEVKAVPNNALKPKLHRLGSVILVAVLAGCASSPAISYGSLGTTARGGQAANVAGDIAAWHNNHHPDCRYVRPLGVEVLRDEGDSALEHWTIEACDGQEFTYRAYLLPGNGLTVMVSDVFPEDRGAP